MPLGNARKGDFTLEELLHPKTSLAKHYHKKLPVRGWAGRFNKTEKEYVKLVKEARQKSNLRASGRMLKHPKAAGCMEIKVDDRTEDKKR